MNKQFTYLWFWKKRLPERKGQECRVLARGRLNTILVEFKDGFKVTTASVIALLVLILAQIACMTTVEPYITYPPDETPDGRSALTRVPASFLLTEPASGAVFEIDNLKSEIENQCAIVTASQALHLRAEPSERAAVLDYLYSGEQVTLIASAGDWWNMQAGSMTGWAKAEYLQEGECE